MSAQRYSGATARARLAAGLCPECGSPAGDHTGAGGPGCNLTDNGVAGRIAQYQADAAGSTDGVRLVITSSEGPVAELDGYTGPVPRPGEYISRPSGHARAQPNVMSVKSVTYGILDRAGPTEPFTAAAQPWVEVWV